MIKFIKLNYHLNLKGYSLGQKERRVITPDKLCSKVLILNRVNNMGFEIIITLKTYLIRNKFYYYKI